LPLLPGFFVIYSGIPGHIRILAIDDIEESRRT
jgi:hypothetical protein